MKSVNAMLGAMVLGMLSGCATLKIPSDAQDREPQARVRGDYRLRAGAPVNLFLRSVDGVALKFWQHAADMPSGEHRLLVDCSVTASEKLSRHEVMVVVEPGATYQLVAEAAPSAGCTQVGLRQVD